MHFFSLFLLAGSLGHATDLSNRKTGVGLSVAQTSRHDTQGGIALTFRTKDQLLVRVHAPLARAAYINPAFGAGADVLWRTGPELTSDDAHLFVRYGGGTIVGTDRYGVNTIVVTQGVAGAEVHLGSAPAAIELELRPQLLLAPYRAVDLAVAGGISWWF